MLPTKIRNHLIRRYGDKFYQFPPKSIMRHLNKFETESNLFHAILFPDKVVKIVINHPDGEIETLFHDNDDVDSIKSMIRDDNEYNYHDYLTTFKFNTNHTIYDLIVEVIYRYVYSIV